MPRSECFSRSPDSDYITREGRIRVNIKKITDDALGYLRYYRLFISIPPMNSNGIYFTRTLL